MAPRPFASCEVGMVLCDLEIVDERRCVVMGDVGDRERAALAGENAVALLQAADLRPALALGEQGMLAGDIEGFAFAVGTVERDMDDARRRAAEQVRDRAERLCAGKGVARGDEIADRDVPDLLLPLDRLDDRLAFEGEEGPYRRNLKHLSRARSMN